MSDIDDDLCKGSFTYEAEEVGGNELGCLTSCVRTWWFQVAELLYGSTYYGLEIDLWSLGCVFAKLLTSKPLFPGTSDVDQLSRIRTTTMELLQDKYFSEEPLPIPISELRVPLTRNGHDQDSLGGHNEMGLDSDLEEFDTLNITTTSSDLSKQIP
ncbi:Cyclin-dependent kinase F-1 [Glycine soja]